MTVPVPLERQIACVRRELSMRRRVYPGWIERGRMTQDEADRQIEAMEAVQATLEREQLKQLNETCNTPGLF